MVAEYQGAVVPRVDVKGYSKIKTRSQMQEWTFLVAREPVHQDFTPPGFLDVLILLPPGCHMGSGTDFVVFEENLVQPLYRSPPDKLRHLKRAHPAAEGQQKIGGDSDTIIAIISRYPYDTFLARVLPYEEFSSITI